MYKNTFERAFSDVEPKISDEEFIYRITKAAEEKKARRLPKKAVIIPIIAAVLALGTVTASAAGGFLSNFCDYFLLESESELEAAGAAESDNTYSFDGYTLKINGYIADSACFYVSYDITYKKEKYFKYRDSEVLSVLVENPPVQFFLKNQTAFTFEYGKGVSSDGDTVRYIQRCDGNFNSEPLNENGEREFDVYFYCFDNYYPQAQYDGKTLASLLGFFETSVCIPPARERCVTINEEIALSDGTVTVLEKAYISPLGIKLQTNNDYYSSSYYSSDNNYNDDPYYGLSVKTKDGKDVALCYDTFAISYTDELLNYFDSREKPTPAETTAVPEEQAPFETTTAVPEEALAAAAAAAEKWPYGKLDIPSMLHFSYETAIDPDDVAEIGFMGYTFAIE